MQVLFQVNDCLRYTFALRKKHKEGGSETAIGYLMRMAVAEKPSKAMVLALCRMFFVSQSDEPLRGPGLGQPLFLGDTSAENWPMQPIHMYKGIPFFVVRGWTQEDKVERSSNYLAYCLQMGFWNLDATQTRIHPDPGAIANEFIKKGPWKKPLTNSEKLFILSQI